MSNLWSRLTGGRPMTQDGFAFTDVVSGKPVFYWIDTRGREWLAENSWSLFRVLIGRAALDKEGAE